MLRTCIQQIGEEVNRLESRVAVVRESWNDQVSAHVEHSYIEALSSACHNFYSEAYQIETTLRQYEESLKQLADQY